MARIEEQYPWTFLVISILLVVNALLWMIEGLSRSKNAYVSLLFIVLSLVGSGYCLSVWRRNRAAKGRDS